MVRLLAFQMAAFWRLFPDTSVRAAAIDAFIRAQATIERFTDKAGLDPEGLQIARLRQSGFFEALIRVRPVMPLLDRGPLTLYDSATADSPVCSKVRGGEAVTIVGESNGRVGFQLASIAIDGQQCESVRGFEFAPVDRTFWIDKSRIVLFR
jgi:hypothetical protein